MINAFGHMPKRGESIDIEGFNIKVLRADKRRVHILLFSRVEKELSENDIESSN